VARAGSDLRLAAHRGTTSFAILSLPGAPPMHRQPWQVDRGTAQLKVGGQDDFTTNADR